MILRIKKINQIGRFKKFNTGGSVTLGDISGNKKICAILGDNTYGKSTLADIFRSANSDDSAPIVQRQTIPPAERNDQIVELSYYDSTSASEKNINYGANTWTNNLLKDKVLIFDQVFIHNNVFTGIDITRENKENFTDFILGEDGVKIGEEIEARKKATRKFPEELMSIRPEFVKQEADVKKVEDYVSIVVTESKENLEMAIVEQRKLIERLDKVSDFKNLPTIEYIDETYAVQLDQLAEMLLSVENSSYDSVSKDALDQIQEQLERTDGNWLEKGTKYIDGDRCPFCTQETSAVTSLIDAYKTIFDEKYDTYVNGVNTSISSIKTKLNTLATAIISDGLDKSAEAVKKYLPFIDELKERVDCYDVEREKLRNAEIAIREYVSESLQSKIAAFLHEKQTNIHKKSSLKIALDDIKELVDTADAVINALSKLLKVCSVIINGKRDEVAKWAPEVIEKKKAIAKNAIVEAERKVSRLAHDLQCKTYISKQKEHELYKARTLSLQNQLEAEQSNYLKLLFSSINSWFKKLGSSDFELKCKQSSRGNKTVYELTVLFCNKSINSDNLSKVFSDSDRRNLALAVFLARAEQLEKERTILLFDDPVVSFDDNRITMTCNELKRISPDFEQIIILTHYKTLIMQLLKCKADATFVKIERDSGGARLVCFDTADFLLSDHEKDYHRLASFANGDLNEATIILQLRPFMERHIDLMFQPELTALSLVNVTLNDKINGLRDAYVISEDIANQLHVHRESLNPEHHSDIGDVAIENNRVLIKSVLESLYNLHKCQPLS